MLLPFVIVTILLQWISFIHTSVKMYMCVFFEHWCEYWASQVALVVENLPANAGVVREAGFIPGSGRSPGGGHGNLLQYSCLENPMVRGAWWATIYRVVKSWTRLKQLSTLCLWAYEFPRDIEQLYCSTRPIRKPFLVKLLGNQGSKTQI